MSGGNPTTEDSSTGTQKKAKASGVHKEEVDPCQGQHKRPHYLQTSQEESEWCLPLLVASWGSPAKWKGWKGTPWLHYVALKVLDPCRG